MKGLHHIQTVFLILAVGLLSGCSRLAGIPMSPEMTPQQWLGSHPHLDVSFFVLAEPSSSIIVFFLGFLTLWFGLGFLRERGRSRCRYWWGIGLLLWGIGTLFAGISYQAFSYEIKCAGRDICAWTSWFEVIYMIFEIASINALLLAVGWSTLDKSGRVRVRVYTLLNMLIYFTAALTGGFLPNRFLVSFELMLLFAVPGILLAFILNVRGYRRRHDLLNRRLIITWLFLFGVMLLYYAYLLSGIPERLWERGIWFVANDVLHLGLIAWMVYIYTGVRPCLKDAAER